VVGESSSSPATRSRSRMPLAIAVCVVGTTVLIVAIVVAMNGGKHTPSDQPVAHGSNSTSSAPSSPSHPTATSNQSAPSSTPSSSASTTSSSSASTPSTSATDVAGQLSSFLTSYYSLLPGNQDQAFNSLTTSYQQNKAKGLSGYHSWWNGIQRVELKDVVAQPPTSVTASIYYYFKDGTRTEERTAFTLVQDGSTWKIAGSNPLSSQPF
jgi:hypothetical protein